MDKNPPVPISHTPHFLGQVMFPPISRKLPDERNESPSHGEDDLWMGLWHWRVDFPWVFILVYYTEKMIYIFILVYGWFSMAYRCHG